MKVLPSNIFKIFSDLYNRLYDAMCFTDESPNILHYSYLSTYQLHQDLKRLLAQKGGDILDFGCGKAPYRKLFRHVDSYTGVDHVSGEAVDVIVKGVPLPLSSHSYDVVLSTQVFEHVETVTYLGELMRVLRPGGEIIIGVPFLYAVHDEYDFRRFTDKGIKALLEEYGFQVTHLKTQGAIGSTVVIMVLYFYKRMMSQSRYTKALQFPLLPVWLLVTLCANVLGRIFDAVDTTNMFYNNVLVVARRPS